MNTFRIFLLLSVTYSLFSCATGQKPASYVLSPKEFNEKVSTEESPIIIDVRTPKEYSSGHLTNSKNINWNDDNFENNISEIDKSKPVYVYCLSGGRSHEAAEKMRSDGFTTVYEMDGGMLKWRNAGLPEEGDVKKAEPKGMSKNDFEELLESDKLVVVDFYAEWCGPCKKMKPYLEEMESKMSDKVKLVRIDIDANPGLAKSMKIDAIPVIHFYKNNQLSFSNIGFIDKNGFYKELEKEGVK